MSRRRRPAHTEPARCICQPGPEAHHEHGRPRRSVVEHNDPKCPHWCRPSSGTWKPPAGTAPRKRRIRRVDPGA